MRKLLLIALIVIAGCQKAEDPNARLVLPIEKVPAKLLKSAQKRFPDVKFDTAWLLSNGTTEVRGKNKIGKIHEVELAATGEIVETN
jgi:hypothetical protein